MFEVFYWCLGLFLASLAIFIFVLTHERRSMWAGFTLTTTLMFLGFLAIDTIIIIDTKFPKQHQLISQIVLLLAVGVALLIFAFVILLILMFLYDGIKILLKEGTKWTNFLSLGMAAAIILLIFAYPRLGRLTVTPWFRFIYLFLSLSIFYLIFIMVMYTLTSWLNLINIRQKPLNYVVVLGAGLIGKKVTPLLASRINRGIEIYRRNPGSKLIMSGGQGPDEEIPESHAMAAYTEKRGVPKSDILIEDKSKTTNENLKFSHRLMKPNTSFCLVTNSYHVYRALVLAKRQGLQCIGYGAKTKWYFTLNAFIREFIAYLVITKKLQATMIASIGGMTLLLAGMYYLSSILNL
ncbi:YdcF family protein [uncultured Lactobacillus sp.]|uniref:YdcF family protein n=1 Tax=uncultured Lactobacillus sp. TaxID=153152 RepID=UPI0026117AD8|nr:YdcF family protein [uncultured Lactobacillus sp.]